MTHDFNKPFLEVVRFAIEPLPVALRNTNTLFTSRCNLIIKDLPSKMFEATNVVNDLWKLSERLTSKFSRQQIDLPVVTLIVYVATDDYDRTFEFRSKDDPAFYNLKRLLLTTFGSVFMELNIRFPLCRAATVYDQFINLLHRQYLQCREYQNTYECQNVLF